MLGFFSCGKEAVVELPETSIDEYVLSRSEEDCTCRMMITGISGASPDNTLWTLGENGTGSPYVFYGLGNSYYNDMGQLSLPPSGFKPIMNPFEFTITVFNSDTEPGSFTINTLVRCSRRNEKGQIATYTQTHNFVADCANSGDSFMVCNFNTEFECADGEDQAFDGL